jgi:NAD(P)-dependent dehydrogenase (short-subunit alcohol dehydrogenase family)
MIRNQKRDPEICTEDFKDRLVVITGATSGIGFAAAEKFASQGADILSINRNEEKSKKLCKTLESQYGTECTYLLADFSKLADVHSTARELLAMDRRIDVLIHNAGVFFTQRTLTEDDIEIVFQTNFLAPFILNFYLKDKLIEQNCGRILFVNSEAHRFAVWGLNLDDLDWEKRSYSGLKSYGAAKLAQLLSMIKLNSYFLGTDVTVNAMHPGNVKTNSGQNNGPIYKFFKRMTIDRSTIDIGKSVEALYYLGVSGEVENISGQFFNLTTLEEPAPPALDMEAAEELWKLSQKLGGLN